ncbi:MAG: tetratricopeptide repeat protein [Fimbriimonadaceae bacterium]|nr:tetratricopeptide repeat protein [Fimbriimonadaceae bacterium]
MSKRLLLPLLSWLLVAPAMAAVTIKTNYKNGDSIKGDVTFEVEAESDNLITSVEFYVGSDLRDTDQSTPYQFSIDSLTEDDGPIEVTFAAYDSEGGSAKAILKLRVDNGMALGAARHVSMGQELMNDGKYAEAIYHGRVAIKIEPENNDARLLLSRSHLSMGTLDLAQKYAEDVVASDPNNSGGLALLGGVNLRRGFLALERGTGDWDATISSVRNAFKSAASAQRTLSENRISALQASNPESMDLVDALIDARRYSLAISQLEAKFRSNPGNPEVNNRLIYAYIRSARWTDAAEAVKKAKDAGGADAYTYALDAVISQVGGNTAMSEASEKEALFGGPNNLGVKSAQVWLALRRNNMRGFGELTNELRSVGGPSIIADYYRIIALSLARDPEASRKAWELTVLSDPGSPELLIERAMQAYAYSYTAGGDVAPRQKALAKALAEAAIEARPESFEALTLLAVMALEDNNREDAYKWGRAAAQAAPQYAPGQYAYAGALAMNNRSTDARAIMEMIGTLDKNLVGQPAPGGTAAFRYMYLSGRMPWLVPPGRAAARG